jgi:hypothetical protein
MIKLSTIHPRTCIIARPPLGECRYPRVVSGSGDGRCITGHSFARLMLRKMMLKAWHTSGRMVTDNNQPLVTGIDRV